MLTAPAVRATVCLLAGQYVSRRRYGQQSNRRSRTGRGRRSSRSVRSNSTSHTCRCDGHPRRRRTRPAHCRGARRRPRRPDHPAGLLRTPHGVPRYRHRPAGDADGGRPVVLPVTGRARLRPIVLVPTRGGNFGPVRTVAPDVARELDAAAIPLADRDGRAAADRGTRRGGHRVRPGSHPRRRRRDGGRDGHRRGPRADGGHRAGPRAAGPDRPPAERGARDGPRERRPRRPDRGDPGAGETTTRRVVDAYVDHTEAERQSV